MTLGFQTVKDQLSRITTAPGCYLMHDYQGEVFYIGKAKNLRARLKSYFLGTDSRLFVQYLEHILAKIDVMVVQSDKEALILERELIKKHQPRFNIMLKDDKNYILLKVKRKKTSGRKRDMFAKIEVVRKTKHDDARYFGPYPSANALRMTLEIINKNFRLRTCPDNVLENRVRPCIQYQIGRCMAPCVFDTPDYQTEVDNAILFLQGNLKEVEKRLQAKMWVCAKDEQFEAAAKLRDQLDAIKTSLAKQVVSEVNLRRNQDIIGFARAGPEVEIVKIVVRGGVWSTTENFKFSDQPFPSEEIVRSFLHQAYGDMLSEIPHDILFGFDIAHDLAALKEKLEAEAGRKVNLSHPSKGKLRRLVEIANTNAETSLKSRIEENNANDRAVRALQDLLGLAVAPKRIECIDISLIQGTDPFGSVVVFIDGKADKSLYRIYKIKSVAGMDDFAMINEVVDRRIKRGVKEGDLPDLLLIDGGKGQLHAAMKAIEKNELLITKDGFFVAGIAKARAMSEAKTLNPASVIHSSERLFVPDLDEPVLLNPHTFERYLVEKIRDEAHRFALTAHRRSRSKRTIRSNLLDIPGIGKKRALTLLKTFGSVSNIKGKEASEIAQAIKVSEEKAKEILRVLHKSLDTI